MTRKAKLLKVLKVFVAVCIVGSAALLAYKLWNDSSDAPEELWASAMKNYDERRWTRAGKNFTEFAANFPEDERTATASFLVDMSVAGEAIYSQTGDAEKGLAAMEEIFRKHRDSKAYRDFFPNLQAALEQLVGRLIDRANKSNELKWLKSAATAHELLATVSAAMDDPSAQARTAGIAEQIVLVERTIKQKLARAEIIANLGKIAAQKDLDPDLIYAAVDQSLAEYPELSGDKEILSLRKAAYKAEATRITYVAEIEGAGEPARRGDVPSAAATLVIVGGEPAAPHALLRQQQVVLGMARGVLYAFDSLGNLLWTRRLGIDTQRLPVRLEATGVSPAAFVAVSTADNSLLALERTTGRVLWQYQVGEDISLPPVIVSTPATKSTPAKRRGLLPTSSGDVHVLELVLGKLLGRFKIGQPVSASGAYDDERNLVLLPAGKGRVFALNPAAVDNPNQPACRSVLMTNHSSGSLRGPPIVIGPYLVMPEAADLERMQLRAFALGSDGFADPQARPLEEKSLSGWSWFPPLSSPDRIVLTTDEGDLGVFGVNLDNQDEALYRVIEGDQAVRAHSDAFRSMAVHADEHLLWIMSGGHLQHLAIDVIRQQIKTIWPTKEQPAQIFGVPVHEAQMDSSGRVFYLNLMSYDGASYELTAVNARTGEKLWQRPLGISVAGDPLVSRDGALLLDQAGRSIEIPMPGLSVPNGSQTAAVAPIESQLPPDAIASELMRLGNDPASPVALVVPLGDRRAVAVKRLSAKERRPWIRLILPESLAGQPAVVGQFLAAPCADGLVHFVQLEARGSESTPPTFRWSKSLLPGPDHAHVYALSPDRLLVIDVQQRVRRLDRTIKDGIPFWKPVASDHESQLPLLLPPIITDKRIVLADSGGMLRCLDINNPGQELWSLPLGGQPSAAPVLRNKRIIAVIENTQVACIANIAAPKEVSWTSEPFKGRICGLPSLLGNDGLLLADNSRKVTALQLVNGKVSWVQALPPRLGPASAPAAVGDSHILQALTDGTVVWLRQPTAPAKVAEAK